ncbi:MAG: NAD(P)H-hydrate epimerase, partial [Bacteroidota bacterium]
SEIGRESYECIPISLGINSNHTFKKSIYTVPSYAVLLKIPKMGYDEFIVKEEQGLSLDRFKEMDYYAVEHYNLPIELMMENAGLHLAHLVALSGIASNATILVGVGNGNNGGGGLVAARRLAAWGFTVHLDIMTPLAKTLPKKQLDRAVAFGAKTEPLENPEVWIDAYLGFSQRLPLPPDLLSTLEKANARDCHRISLDIPTGFLGSVDVPYFHAHQVLSLAAPKTILFNLPPSVAVYVADLGIPKEVYSKFGVDIPPFARNTLLRLLSK